MPNNLVHTPHIASRLPNVGTTIFSVMSQMAEEYGSVNLGQGYPSFKPPEALIQLVTQAMVEGDNQYAPMTGLPALRYAIQQKMRSLYGMNYEHDTEITVTSGATQALFTAVMASVGPGDEVIVLEPAYDSYLPAIHLAGATAVPVPLLPPCPNTPHYRVDWQRVGDAITPRTRLLMLNFPHNPTGAILRPSDLDALEQLLRATPIVVISDEVYEHIVFDGNQHLSMATRPELAARSFVISSFGKTYHATGWKIGYCCAPAALSREFRKVHQFVVYSVNTPMQQALAQFMQDASTYTSLSQFYQERRDYLAAGLANTGLNALPTEGTFFLLADYSGISDAPQEEFVRWLTVKHKVTAIPVSAFYVQSSTTEDVPDAKLIRLCFAKDYEMLDTALERLREI